MDVNHRFSHGLQFRGVYTFSKSLDDGDSMNTSVATNSPAFAANPLELRVRTMAAVRLTSATPPSSMPPTICRSDAGGAANEWVNRVIANWQLSGIETLQSGLPVHAAAFL